MASDAALIEQLRGAWGGEPPALGDDYTLLMRLHDGYAARTRDGSPAFVVPLEKIDASATGKRAAGCELRAINAARFQYATERWEGAAAALVCHDASAVEAFAVLITDIASRLPSAASWQHVAQLVGEWQALLAAARRPSNEGELGLWGELWFISRRSSPSLLVDSWRGPDRDATDFFAGGVAAEVKASRHQRQHHVSLSQVSAPTGEHASFLLSLWVKEDPIRGSSVPELISRIESTVEDRALLLRRLLRAGYSSSAGAEYRVRYSLMTEPEWYPTAVVPRVRAADPGVSNIRYRVMLDEGDAASPDQAAKLWQHFLGHSYIKDVS